MYGLTFLTMPKKVLLFMSVVWSVLLYACETWPGLKGHVNRLEVLQTTCLRLLCRLKTWHTARTSQDRLPFQCTFGQ